MSPTGIEDRAAEARREVERTVSSRAQARLLVGSFLLMIVAPASWRLLHSPGPINEAARLVRPLADSAIAAGRSLAVGQPVAANRHLLQAMVLLEDQLEEDSPLRGLLLAPANELLSGWGGAPAQQVYAGRGGWLFLRDAVDHVTGPGFLRVRRPSARRAERLAQSAQPPPSGDPLESLLAFQAELSRRGALLLVLPVPGKVTIHPLQLSAFASAEDAPQNPDLRRFVAALEQRGIVVLDPTPILHRARAHGEQYLLTDSHWRPEAVQRVARALADTVSRLEAEGRLVLEPPGDRRFAQGAAQAVTHRGDLVHALGLQEQSLLYPAQRVEIVPVREMRSGRAVPWQERSDADILLLGDSFTNVYSQAELGWGSGAGLAEQLSFFLARPLDRIAINAGGPRAVREAIERTQSSGVDRLDGKRLVIYEFAARELSSGDWTQPRPTRP